MIYAVFGGCYSDWYVIGYFDNREDAEKYCAKYGTKDDFYVKEIHNLSKKFDLSDVKLMYQHEIVFDLQNNEWIMRNEPTRYSYYSDTQLRCNNVRDSRIFNVQPWIIFSINLSENNRKKAEKIAQDYLYELIYNSNKPNNSITTEAVDDLNDIFKERNSHYEQRRK